MEWLYYSIGAVVLAVITFVVGRAAGIAHRKKVAETIFIFFPMKDG